MPFVRILALCVLCLYACGPREPIRIGLIAGLSSRTSDTGEGARNGLLLAIEQRNAQGGIQGRKIEMVAADDGQDPVKAVQAINELIAARPSIILGPLTSSMAEAVLPVVNQSNVVLLSPVITSLQFVGKDDMFFRLNRTTRDNAEEYSREMLADGQRRVAIAYDIRNRSFTESWLHEFRRAFQERGGTISSAVSFASSADTAFGEVSRQLLASHPQGLLFIANAIDVARLAQQARKHAPAIPLTAVEWAASEQLLELGGKAVEGLLIAQSHNRTDTSPRFTAFVETYRQRFHQEPGYTAVATYDAATVFFTAMERRQPNEPLKAALLRCGPYQLLQQQIEFTPYGDTTRQVYFTRIQNGRFVLVR